MVVWRILAISTSLKKNFFVCITVGLNLTTSGDYNININFFRWLESAPTYFRIEGKQYNASDKSLYINASYSENGVDEFGAYQRVRYRYYAGKTIIDCSINTYDDSNFVVFEQVIVFLCAGNVFIYRRITVTFLQPWLSFNCYRSAEQYKVLTKSVMVVGKSL